MGTNYGSNPDWKPVSDLFSNLNVSTIAYDPSNPNTMYFGTGEDYENDFLANSTLLAFASTYNRGAGIWKSSDGGTTWLHLGATISLPTDLTFSVVRKIVVKGNGHVFAATRQGVMQSTNGGTDWVKVLDGGMPVVGGVVPADLHQVSDLEVGLDNIVYASMGLQQTNSAIFRLIGSAWEQLNRVGSGMATSGQYKRIELACAPNDGNILYALAENAVTASTVVPSVRLYRSADRGLSWSEISFASMGTTTLNANFSQPDHSLAIAINPTNAKNIYLGGRDLYRCGDVTTPNPVWEQLSWWSLQNGDPKYIHADQHQIIFESAPSGSPKVAYVASDGGIFRVSALNSSSGILGDIACSNYNNNFRATQLYTAAVSRGASTFDALGGFQDNGTELFSQSYLWATTQVNGGDGGYCFIHPNNTNLQVTSSQYGDYDISTDGNRSHSQPAVFANNKSKGGFITATDCSILAGDVVNMISDGSTYSTGLTQIFRWNNIFGTNPTMSPFTDPLLVGHEITFIKVSPNDNNRVYIGLNNWTTKDIRIVKVENINTIPAFTNFTGTFTGASSVKGYISCIAIKKSSTGATDDDDIVFTLSNYGVQSVWKKDFNAVINPINPNWSPLDLLSGGSLPGNLPDMPVRWAVFPPSLNNTFGHQLLLATETGVWATDYLNGTSTRWFPMNNNRLPKVRTQALICRETDGMLFAATHERGLWRSDVYAYTKIDFNAEIKVIQTPTYKGRRIVGWTTTCNLELTDLSTHVFDRYWDIDNNGTIDGSTPTISVPYCNQRDVRLMVNGIGIVKRLQDFIAVPWNCPTCIEPVPDPIGLPVFMNKKASEEESIGDLMVYPNPNQGVFNIQMEPDWGKMEQMEVYNSTGKLIQISESAIGEINIEQEPTGIYMCRVKTSKGKILIGKVLKQ